MICKIPTKKKNRHTKRINVKRIAAFGDSDEFLSRFPNCTSRNFQQKLKIKTHSKIKIQKICGYDQRRWENEPYISVNSDYCVYLTWIPYLLCTIYHFNGNSNSNSSTHKFTQPKQAAVICLLATAKNPGENKTIRFSRLRILSW